MFATTLAHLGRIDAMPHGDYLASPGVSNSGLKALRKSPWHYRALTDPSQPKPEKTPSPAQFAGTLAHCALLEPEAFPERYPVGPDVSKNSNAWKDYCRGLPAGAVPISALQRDVAQAQAASLLKVPKVADLFARPGANEVSIFWRDEASGLLCKARPDRVIELGDGVILFDAKTAADASRNGFAKAVANFAYHSQAAFYSRGWRAACGQHVYGMVFGVVESDFPYAANAYMLADTAIQYADNECTQLLALLAGCEERQEWPGYPDGMAAPLDVPQWALAQAASLEGVYA